MVGKYSTYCFYSPHHEIMGMIHAGLPRCVLSFQYTSDTDSAGNDMLSLSVRIKSVNVGRLRDWSTLHCSYHREKTSLTRWVAKVNVIHYYGGEMITAATFNGFSTYYRKLMGLADDDIRSYSIDIRRQTITVQVGIKGW